MGCPIRHCAEDLEFIRPQWASDQVVHGADGMDELTLTGETRVWHAEAGRGVWTETVTPEDAGLARVRPEAIAGGGSAENARLLTAILEGAAGPLADATIYNAAGALVAAGLAKTLREGVELARETVRAGRAREALARAQKPSGAPGAKP